MDDISDDWQAIQELRAALLGCLPTPGPTDFEEDWDALRPSPDWFVALYDADRQLILGTVIRAKTLNQVVTFPAPSRHPEFIGYWSKAEPKVGFIKAPFSAAGHSRKLMANLQLMHVKYVSMSTATTVNWTIPANTSGTNAFTVTNVAVTWTV